MTDNSYLVGRCASIAAALRSEANIAARPRQTQRLLDLADLVEELPLINVLGPQVGGVA